MKLVQTQIHPVINPPIVQCGLRTFKLNDMKKIISLLLFITIIGCTEEYDLTDRELAVEALPGYVAFSANGASTALANVETDENGDDVELNVEVPSGTLSDVAVTYSFGGNAVFGIDFMVSGASASGGQITIIHRQSTDPDDAFADNEDIIIQLLTDDITDGEKTLQVTLESATNSEGPLAIGRGGISTILTSTSVIIADVD